MNILVLGGTRFFGVHLVRELIKQGHKVTIATRGNKVDEFGDRVNRIKVDHANFIEMKNAFLNKKYDVVYDDIAYASLDVKYALETIKCDKYIMVSTCMPFIRIFLGQPIIRLSFVMSRLHVLPFLSHTCDAYNYDSKHVFCVSFLPL